MEFAVLFIVESRIVFGWRKIYLNIFVMQVKIKCSCVLKKKKFRKPFLEIIGVILGVVIEIIGVSLGVIIFLKFLKFLV